VAKRILVLDEGCPEVRKVGANGGCVNITLPADWCGERGIVWKEYVTVRRGAYEDEKDRLVFVIEKLNAKADSK